MGDRASVSFRRGDWESVALFSHWGGRQFQKEAQEYADALTIERDRKGGMPLDRLDPPTVMVDFIRHLTTDLEVVESNYYLGVDGSDGDNGDNGHVLVELEDR